MSSILDDLKLQFKTGDVITKLIFWNIFLFGIPTIVFSVLKLFKIDVDYLAYVSLSSNPYELLTKPWSIISYAFFHSGILHVLFNLLLLHFAGRIFLTFFTQKQFLNLYLVSAIFAGMLYIISYMVFPALIHNSSVLIGASGAVMAIIVATATYQPMMELRLLIFGTVKLVYVVLIFLCIDLIQLPLNNTGGHIAHIGGALFGYIYIKQLQKGTDITAWFTKMLDSIAILFGTKKKTPFKKVHVNPKKTIVKTESKIVTKDKTQQQIDEILDKISQSGYDALTKEEKEFLFKAGK